MNASTKFFGKAARLAAVAAAVSAAAFAAPAHAQTYPDRAVTIVVGSPPGGGSDLAARLVAAGLQKALGQTFVVENKGGASGNIANYQVARAPADGYTLLLAYSGYQVVNPALFPKTLQWDPIKSFAPVAMVMKAPHIIVVKSALPVKTLAELVAYAKANPGKLNYASVGQGSLSHIGGEMFDEKTGVKMVHVPYRGSGPAVTDLVGGNVDVFINTPQSLVGFLQSGAIRGLAVTSSSRLPMVKDLPTVGEAGLPGFDLEAWYALYAPAGTPQPVVDKLAAAVKTLVESPEFKATAEQNGAYAVYMGPKELAGFTAEELKFWADAVKKANITLE
ncbi:Bug family tripartite tricarboxylate transporter substrate binding protein [Aquabacter spiritensis]|uniref:Tripartite-type tricarboxylate transporter receptor subunit TctC n=1 Tax=Aquabacter spiritensis TaxID=933073 RepID=A0A4R3LUE6_9HYPH|nr:tripartite tricarboxylate transporter substrate binding protein [Aquabacter spiritensis]TCT04230.1 tripartite-type tricarboxylate transporter receptor subunit TctC [Aquabacter spiritensis]